MVPALALGRFRGGRRARRDARSGGAAERVDGVEPADEHFAGAHARRHDLHHLGVGPGRRVGICVASRGVSVGGGAGASRGGFADVSREGLRAADGRRETGGHFGTPWGVGCGTATGTGCYGCEFE